MAATRTSVAWQGFRHSNLISTSAPTQALTRSGYADDSDGAEEDGFVGTDSNGSQEMMMEIMDKYVQAGEALAEKENDMRQLMKQVDELKATNSDLENRTAQLTEANEKLADNEGRWYSLARELENQMDVIKKGETYTLFQDKVDEAEARLEVAAEASNLNKKRLHQVYDFVNDAFEASNADGGDPTVDDHHLHATILEELRGLKSSVKELEDALVATQEEHAAVVEDMKRNVQAEKDLRVTLEEELGKLRDETRSRDAASQSQVDDLRRALEGAKRSRSDAEERALAFEEARSKAQKSLGVVSEELALKREETQRLRSSLGDARATLETSQQEVVEIMRRAQEAAAASVQESAGRSAEFEARLQQAQSHSSKVESDLRQQMADLTERMKSELDAAAARAARAEAEVSARELQLSKSLERGDELEGALQAVRAQLEEATDRNVALTEARKKADDKVDHMREALKRAKEEAHVAAQRYSVQAEELRRECERTSFEANTLREALRVAEAEASAGQQFAAQLEAQRLELEGAKSELDALRQESKRTSEEADALRLELEKANSEVEALRLASKRACQEVDELRLEVEKANSKIDALRTASKRACEEADALRLDLERANADVSAAQEHFAQQTSEMREEMTKARAAAAAENQRQAAHARALDQELERVTAEVSSSAQQHAGARAKTKQAEQHHAAETESLRRELEVARAKASAAQDYTAQAKQLREELEGVAATAQERADSNAILRRELDEAHAAFFAAREDAANLKLARVAAEESVARAEVARIESEEEALQARRRYESRLSEAQQSREELMRQAAKLSEDMRNLETRLAEADAFGKEAEAVGKRLREDLYKENERVACLERNLSATRAELDGKTSELARVVEEASAAARGVQDTRSLGHHTSNGGSGSAVVANGGSSAVESAVPGTPPPFSHNAEAEQLQAHAEAMELELRYTLESFEGQLSAMAREKVAIQKQVKELTGQCTTLRKQVSHYKKLAKESEAHVEQIMDLQQQLCCVEATVDSLRADNSNLKSKLDVLEADQVSPTLWRQTQNEMSKLRTRLAEVEDLRTAEARELAAKARAAESATARTRELERRVRAAESELSSVVEVSASTAADLASSHRTAKELEKALTRVSGLEAFAASSEGEKQHLRDLAEACRAQTNEAQMKCEELEEAVRSLQDEKEAWLDAARQTNESQATLLAQFREIESAAFDGPGREDAAASTPNTLSVKEKIAKLREQLSAAENLLEDTARALKQTALEGEVDLAAGHIWLVDGVTSLQRRLQVVESKLRDSAEAQESVGYYRRAMEDLSGILECDRGKVVHKVHELKKLSLEVFQQQDESRKEIQRLSVSLTDEALRGTRNAENADKTMRATRQAYERDLASAREQAASLQAAVESLRREVMEAQDVRVRDMEEHRREEAVLRKSYEDLSARLEGEHGGVAGGEGNEYGYGNVDGYGYRNGYGNGNGNGYGNGDGQQASTRTANTGVTASIATETDGLLPGSANAAYGVRAMDEASQAEAVSILSEIQAMLGCKVEEVVVTLEEQQALAHQHHVTAKVLDEITQSYLYNMDSLASSIAHEAYSRASSLLVKASELWSKGAHVNSSREGLELVDEVTSILRNVSSQASTVESQAYQSALHRAEEEVARLEETMRRERSMMMVFRRWGHFYLALSNEALRKRTKERNQARSQRHSHSHAPEHVKKDQPDDYTGLSDPSVSDESVPEQKQGEVSVHLSMDDVHAMMNEEIQAVGRELAGEPSQSLVALAGARSEMENMAQRIQATVGVLLAQPPPHPVWQGTRTTSSESSAAVVVHSDNHRDGDTVGSLGHQSSALVNPNGIDPSSMEILAIGHDADHPPSAPPTATTDIILHEQQQLGGTSDPRGHTEQAVSTGDPLSADGAGDAPVEHDEATSSLPSVAEKIEISMEVKVETEVEAKDAAPLPAGDNALDRPSKNGVEDSVRDTQATESKTKSNSGTTSVTLAPPPVSTSTAPPTTTTMTTTTTKVAEGVRASGAAGGWTTGPLVEHGISKEERAEYLRQQKEQRKANRKKAKPGRNNPGADRSTPAPALMPFASGADPAFVAPNTPAPAPAPAPASAMPPPPAPTLTGKVGKDTNDTNGCTTKDSPEEVAPAKDQQAHPSAPSTGGQKDKQESPSAPPSPKAKVSENAAKVSENAPPSGSEITPRPAAPAPPPRMFNPTSVPPPSAPPSAAAVGTSQPPRHPTMAFSVNETVERALNKAEREATLADRKARFWKHRFRDLAFWAASFAILSFASDHSFEPC